MNGNGKLLKIIVQSGMAGITVLVLIGAYFILTNHFEHSNQAELKTAEALHENAKALIEVKSAVQASTAQNVRVEDAVTKLNDNIIYLAK